MSVQLSALGTCLAILAACGGIDIGAQTQNRAQGMFERSLTVTGPVDLTVRTGSGDIQIRTGADDRVLVVGRISARSSFTGDAAAERVRQIETAPPIAQTGNVIRIGDTNNDPRYRDVSISYELTVPVNTQLTSRTGSGDQTIGSLNGAVHAQTGSGDIRIQRTGGSLNARTGSGDIVVDAVAGEIRAQTGSGDIDVSQIGRAGVSAQTGSGDVTLRLPADAAFTLDARTGSGSITTTQPLTVQGRHRRNRVQGKVRGGGNDVRILTGSGSIQIR